jgi:hypothetical protein
MTITARVHNRTIALPPEVEVEEGQEVAVIVPERKAAMPGWLQRAVGTATSGLSTAEIAALTRGEEMAEFDRWLAASTGIAKGRFTTDERMRETRGED